MAKIVVSLADAGESERICSDLRLRRHSVSALGPISPMDNPKKSAEALAAARAEVAILDYLPDDAASVKLLQAATDMGRAPRVIFVLPGGVPVAHILMAVNEGAAAIVENPANLEALANYVERAANGPARFRHEIGRGQSCDAEVPEAERELKAMRTKLAAKRKLVSFLMATPVASQHRSALVVSDSAYQRDYLRKLLEDHGFHVIQAANPGEGLARALEEKPRVVVSDLEMEGKNGIEFCRDLKIDHKFTPCYFVICTANSEKADSVMAPGNGVDACVLKPSNENGNLEFISSVAMGLLL